MYSKLHFPSHFRTDLVLSLVSTISTIGRLKISINHRRNLVIREGPYENFRTGAFTSAKIENYLDIMLWYYTMSVDCILLLNEEQFDDIRMWSKIYRVATRISPFFLEIFGTQLVCIPFFWYLFLLPYFFISSHISLKIGSPPFLIVRSCIHVLTWSFIIL